MIHNIRVGNQTDRLLNVHLQGARELVVETDMRIYLIRSDREIAVMDLTGSILNWVNENNANGKFGTLDFYDAIVGFTKHSYTCDVIEKFEKTGTVTSPNFVFTVIGVQGNDGLISLYLDGHYCYALSIKLIAEELIASTTEIVEHVQTVLLSEQVLAIRKDKANVEYLSYVLNSVRYEIPVETVLLFY